MALLLVGQPYSGKSTIFNEVVGYRSISTNGPGSTVEHTRGEIELGGERVTVVDLPGLYSLQEPDTAERATVQEIVADPKAVVINVIDASVLSRSLELTLQLAELGQPMVIALNMMDEAKRKGIAIDAVALGEAFGVPVIKTTGKKGEGVYDLFRAAQRVGRDGLVAQPMTGEASLERTLEKLAVDLKQTPLVPRFSAHFLAIKLVEDDDDLGPRIREVLEPEAQARVRAALLELETASGQPPELVISAHRHNQAFRIFEGVATVGRTARTDLRLRLDQLLMHPVLGYIFLALILYTTLAVVFRIGNTIEPLFLALFDQVLTTLTAWIGEGTIALAMVHGVVSGFGGGVGIVVPFLLPFFVCLAFLEDTGYLARIAYLVDNLMHRIGLHGMSVVPIVLGYGCSVPGILATRILKSRRDKLITAVLTTLVPCSARMTIIFGLVGFFISMRAALFVYLVNAVLIAATGKVLSLLLPEVSPGLIMEIPRYHLPSPRALAAKTWFRLKEFVVIAWPILIVGSLVLEIVDHFGWSASLNRALAPFTVGLLGFPAVVGVTLLFGIMRKELALILLFAALGTSDVLAVMSQTQIFTYTFFVTFYLPCLATFAALGKELGWRTATLVSLTTLGVVSTLTVALRLVLPLVLE